MGKMLTSARRKIVSKKQEKIPREEALRLEDFEGIGEEHNPTEYLMNSENIAKAILECLESNDPDGVMEVISIYIDTVNKTKLAKTNDLHRQTVYSALKHRNPTIKTLAKIVHAASH